MAIAFDTLEYAQRLKQAGFTPEQAEGQAQALAAAMTESVATKQDLRDLEVRLTAAMDTRFAAVERRFESVETRLSSVETRLSGVETRLSAVETGLPAMEMRLTLRLGGMMVAGVAIISALVKLL